MNWIDATLRIPEMLPRQKDGTRLVSAWVEAILADGTTIEAYYHFHHGWMMRGEPVGAFKYGFVPVSVIKKWREL